MSGEMTFLLVMMRLWPQVACCKALLPLLNVTYLFTPLRKLLAVVSEYRSCIAELANISNIHFTTKGSSKLHIITLNFCVGEVNNLKKNLTKKFYTRELFTGVIPPSHLTIVEIHTRVYSSSTPDFDILQVMSVYKLPVYTCRNKHADYVILNFPLI